MSDDTSTRRSILDAAARAFIHHGYGKTTVRAIAAEAGLAPSSLYTWFAGKEEIFEALRADVEAQAIAIFDSPLPESLTFAQRIESLLLRQAELVHTRRDAIVLLATPGGQVDADLSHPAAYIQAFANWLAVNDQEGALGGRDPVDVAYLIWGAQLGLFYQWLLEGGEGVPVGRQQLLLDLLLGGLA